MEILIIGGALVALMVYVSTRIKRSAAEAFEEETIETGEFALVKPEGFLSPFKEVSEFAFEAYTIEFGEAEEAERIRHAEANLRIVVNESFESRCKLARESVDKILSEKIADSNDAQKVFLLEGEKGETGAAVVNYFKIIAKEEKIFELRVSVLKSEQSLYADRIKKLLESFRVK